MKDINSIRLRGRLGKDPETFSKGTKATLATSRWNAKKEESITNWHSLVFWGEIGKEAAQLSKGDLIEVEGSAINGTYKKNDGSTGYSNDVWCNDLAVMVKPVKKKKRQQELVPQEDEEEVEDDYDEDDDIPF